MHICKSCLGIIVSTVILYGWQSVAWSHGPTPRGSEKSTADIRVFVADASTGDLLSVDLPNAKTVRRLSTPPFIMSLAMSTDNRHLFVMRGRATDRDWITVVNTGLTDVAGELFPPYVARTLPIDTPGPGTDSRMVTVGGKDALFVEGTGEIIVLDNNEFTGYGSVDYRKYKLAAPDHYFYLESGENLYVGHLMKGYVQILDRESGAEVGRIRACPITHGKAMDPATGRLFYACMRDILVLGSRGEEANKVITRIKYPEKQRVGAFLHGPEGVLWAYTEDVLPIIYRFDPATEPYRLEVVPLEPSMRQWTTEHGKYLLSLARSGVLEIRDGRSGEMLRSVAVSGPFIGDYHEHVNKAILPDIKSLGTVAYVSLPHEGRIAVVDLETAEIMRYLETGGEPTRIALVVAAGAPAETSEH